MKLLDRYILRCYMVPLLFCLAGFTLMFLVHDLFDNVSKFMNAEAGPGFILFYYLCLLLPTFEYLAPASLLLASLYTLWQLSRNSELIAMRASGVSLYRIMLPFLLTGVVCSLASAAIKELGAPKAFELTARLKQNNFLSSDRPPVINLALYHEEGKRQWVVDTYQPDTPHILTGVKVTQDRPNGYRYADYVTEKAEWLDGAWWFHNLQMQHYDLDDNPIGGLKFVDPGKETVTELPKFGETPTHFVHETKNWEFFSSWEMFSYLKQHPGLSRSARASKAYDFHARLAIPWSCFIVTIFGIPAGARGGRHSVLSGILLALGCFVGFYVLTQVGLFLGKRQLIEPWLGAWLSNIVYLVWGVILLRRLR